MKVLAFVLLAIAALAARADVAEGEWQMTIATSIPGLPAGMGPIEQRQCLSAADARDPGKLFGGSGAGCRFLNRRDDGSTYRFDLSCTSGAAQIHGSGEVRYASDALEGELVMRLGAEGQSLEMRSRIEARRLGPCR